MALQLSLNDANIGTVSFPSAYVRIIYGRTFATQVIITANFYVDEQARRDEKDHFAQTHYEAPIDDVKPLVSDGDHPHAPFYRYLKTLPEFADAVDV